MSNKIDKRIDSIFAKKSNLLSLDSLAQVKKRKSDFCFLYSSLKIFSILFFTFIFSFGASKVGQTFSYFNDYESSLSNKLQAGILSLNLSSSEDPAGRVLARSFSLNTDTLNNNQSEEENIGQESFEIEVDKNRTNVPIEYSLSGKIDEGSPDGCKNINVSTWFLGEEKNSLFYDFSLSTTTFGKWLFLLSIPEGNSNIKSGEVCSGKIIFTGTLSGVGDDLKNTFKDSKEYSFKIKNWEYNVSSQNIEEPKIEEESQGEVDQNQSENLNEEEGSQGENEQQIQEPQEDVVNDQVNEL